MTRNSLGLQNDFLREITEALLFSFHKSCLLINGNPEDQTVFMEALLDVAPDSLFMLAHDAREALEVLQQERLRPDCVFVELNMPGIDGLEFLRSAKKIWLLKDVPIIIHASEVDSKRAPMLLETGAHAIYFRPYKYAGVRHVLHFMFHTNFNVNVN